MRAFPQMKPRYLFAFYLLVGFLVYGPALSGGLVWDDTFLVGENPLFRSPIFALEVFRHPLFPDTNYFRPVQNLTYIFDYLIGGGVNPLLLHASNIALQAGAACLLAALFVRLLADLAPETDSKRRSILALLAGLLWLVHPAFSAATAYISGRADPLALIFSVSAWLTFRKWKNGWALALTVLLWFLALGSRESAMVWMGAFLLYEVVRAWRWLSLPRLALATLPAAILYGILRRSSGAAPALTDGTAASAPGSAWSSVLALGDYLGTAILPLRLTMERAALQDATPLAVSLVLCFGFLLLLIGAITFRRSPEGRIGIIGLGWFLGTLFPVLPWFAHGTVTMADHWLYVPSIGLLLAGCGLLLKKRKFSDRASVIVFSGLLLFFASRTFERSYDWRNEQAFFEQTLKEGIPSMRATASLASIYTNRGDIEAARTLLDEAMRKNPEDRMLRMYRGLFEMRTGHPERASALLELPRAEWAHLVKVHPNYLMGPLNQAKLFEHAGNLTEAEDIVRAARKLRPDDWRILRQHAELLGAMGRKAEAVAAIEDFVNRHWWHFEATLALAQIEANSGNLENAELLARKSAWLDVHSREPTKLLSAISRLQNASRQVGKTGKAEERRIRLVTLEQG